MAPTSRTHSDLPIDRDGRDSRPSETMKTIQEPHPHGRLVRFFFMHLGTVIGIVVYLVLGERAAWSADGVARAIWTAFAVHTAYAALALTQGELKQFDLGFWLLFAGGAIAAALGATPVLALFQRYAGALIFTTLTLTALVPLLLGRTPFTVYHAVRQTPRWQWRTPSFREVCRVMAGFWVLLFVAAAALCVARPTDPVFTLVYPNLLVFLIGMPAGRWLPPLWLRRFPPPLPDTAEALIMGMPLALDAAAARDARAVIQFRVSGKEPGDYWLRVEGGRSESFEGTAQRADLTVHTPDHVWVGIAHGRLDGARALLEGKYRAEGDLSVLTKLQEWFPRSARSGAGTG